jgi:hypothetical protein
MPFLNAYIFAKAAGGVLANDGANVTLAPVQLVIRAARSLSEASVDM